MTYIEGDDLRTMQNKIGEINLKTTLLLVEDEEGLADSLKTEFELEAST